MISKVQNKNRLVWRGWPHLIVLLFVFFAGVISGFFLAFWGVSNDELGQYLVNYFKYSAVTSSKATLFSAVLDCIGWPLAAFLLSLLPVGAVAIPTIFAVRGFLLSYTVTMLSFYVPGKGIIICCALFAATIILVVPTLFLWGYEGARASSIRKSSSSVAGSDFCFRIEVLLIGIGALLIAVAVQWAVTPLLFHSACTHLF